MEKHQEVSNAEILASVILGTGKTTSIDTVRPISYRIPIRLLARIDALADKSSKSRNFLITSLIELGLDDLNDCLGDEGMQEIGEREGVHLNALIGAADIESNRED